MLANYYIVHTVKRIHGATHSLRSLMQHLDMHPLLSALEYVMPHYTELYIGITTQQLIVFTFG